jgi:hypothetical protein
VASVGLAHHADLPEPDLLVAPDRAGVVDRRAERDAVVADVAGDLAVDDDRELVQVGLGLQRPGLGRGVPPARHLGRAPERPEPLGVLRADGLEEEPLATWSLCLHGHMVASGTSVDIGAPRCARSATMAT